MIPKPKAIDVKAWTNRKVAYINYGKKTRIPSFGFRELDLNNQSSPFSGFKATGLLTPEQINAFKTPDESKNTLGYSYTTVGSGKYAIDSIDRYQYWAAKTVGYYQLRDTMSQ